MYQIIAVLSILLTGSLSNDSGNLNTRLLSIRDQYQLPALCIGDGDAQSFTAKAVGVRKEGSSVPALSTDIYHLGSLTKAMTATLLAVLVERHSNNLTWTSTLPDMLPGFNISSDHSNTTLDQLISHTSGITDNYDSAFILDLYSLSAMEGRWTLTNRSLALPPVGKQGTWTYANTNYVIAGVIIDVLTSSSSEAFIETYLWNQLNMSTAGFGPVPEKTNTSISNPWPHTPSPNGPIPVTGIPNWQKDNPPAFNTAGRAHMASEDYNSFLQLHLGAALGQTENQLNLSQVQFQHLHTAVPTLNASDPGYGYTYGGWLRQNFTVEGREEYVLLHDGSNTLNYAFALLDTNVAEAYMALTNLGGNAAAIATEEVVVGMRNGTLIL